MATMQTPSEETIWEGGPSQWVNFWWFVLCILVIPIPFAVWKWLVVANTKYTLTTQRFRVRTGVLSKEFDDLELYRVKDLTMRQAFIERMAGLGEITMITSDATTPMVRLHAIAEPMQVHDAVRNAVEKCRRDRGVRELDVHDDAMGGAVNG